MLKINVILKKKVIKLKKVKITETVCLYPSSRSNLKLTITVPQGMGQTLADITIFVLSYH